MANPLARIAAVVMLTSTVACGTTTNAPLAGGSQASDGLTPWETTQPGASPGAPGAVGPGDVPLGPVPSSAGTSSTGGHSVHPSRGPSSAPQTGAPARGVTRTALRLGYVTQKDMQATGNAVGIAGIATGDADNQMRAMAASINARGGILGRKIELVPHDVRTVDATSRPDETAGQVCSHFVDAKVFAVINAGSMGPLHSCLSRAGIVAVDSTGVLAPAANFGPALPGVYSPSGASIDRYLPAVVDRLVAQRFFTGWDVAAGRPGNAPVKIGVQSFDNPDGRHFVDVLRRALARHGMTITAEDLHSSDIAQNSAATSNAVLRFRSAGVTHVFEANILFYKYADNQDYHPRYAVDDTIQTPALLAQNVGPSQLHGAMGAGYLPVAEVPNAKDVSPAATACKALMRKAGENMSQPLTVALVLATCDAMTFLDDALTAAGEITPEGLRRGTSLLRGFTSGLTYVSRPTADRHDGASGIRDFVYRDSCTCFAFPDDRIHPF